MRLPQWSGALCFASERLHAGPAHGEVLERAIDLEHLVSHDNVVQLAGLRSGEESLEVLVLWTPHVSLRSEVRVGLLEVD